MLIRIKTSFFWGDVDITPRSPWAASDADNANELAPTELKDAAIKFAKCPDFPTPTSMHFDLQSPIVFTAWSNDDPIFFLIFLKLIFVSLLIFQQIFYIYFFSYNFFSAQI